MIISASYRTDIPAFYGEWFMARLRAGYCRIIRPYSRRAERVSLAREDVDGFVFWSRDYARFAGHLPEIRARGFSFVIHYGITSYPRPLERLAASTAKSTELLKQIAAEYGPRVCVWRYDPIVLSSLTPVDYHLQNFESLARRLAGSTDEVIVSFMHPYKKTVRKLDSVAREAGFAWHDPTLQEKRELVAQLAQIARGHGLQLSVCAQREYIVPGAADAKCIDAVRLADVAGRPLRIPKSGHRKNCGCFASTDIGAYNTCPHGCVYCYAVDEPAAAKRRYQEHDPSAECLFPPEKDGLEDTEDSARPQAELFGPDGDD